MVISNHTLALTSPNWTKGNLRRKLPQFMPHHVLRNQHIYVILSVVNLEDHINEIGENCTGACLGFDRRVFRCTFNVVNWETLDCQRGGLSGNEMRCSYGTTNGPIVTNLRLAVALGITIWRNKESTLPDGSSE